jgi:DNA-binding response OmpR family regulator
LQTVSAKPLSAILVVDDDDDVRDTISMLLSEAGFQVTTAANGLEALAIIGEKPFEMTVVDIRLPGGLSGLEMMRQARLRHPALKCLFISGRGEPTICDPELDDFVAKLFRGFELLGCVRKVLRGNLPQPRLKISRA